MRPIIPIPLLPIILLLSTLSPAPAPAAQIRLEDEPIATNALPADHIPINKFSGGSFTLKRIDIDKLLSSGSAIVLAGHLDPNDSSALSGWQIITPYTTQSSTNPATLQEHSFRIVSLGTNRFAQVGDGGGDNMLIIQGNDSKCVFLDTFGAIYHSDNIQFTNRYAVLRNNSGFGSRSIDLGGPSNLFLRLICSNVVALKLDSAGNLQDSLGSIILQPIDHMASDGLYNWRGPLTTKSITITNIGPISQQEISPDTFADLPDGPGGTSYTIDSPGSEETGYHGLANTLRFLCDTNAGGPGDGWYHFLSGVDNQDLMLHSTGIYWSPNSANPSNRLSLLTSTIDNPFGIGSGRSFSIGSLSNKFVTLKTAAGTAFTVDDQGIWYDDAGNRILDPNQLLMTPDGTYTWGGPCLDASLRLTASGGTGTGNLLISPTLTNTTLRGSTSLASNAQIRFPGVTLSEVSPGGTALSLGLVGELSAFKLHGGQLNVTGTTNQILFGGTNTAPASTTPVLWVSVQFPGDTNAYRLGVCK